MLEQLWYVSMISGRALWMKAVVSNAALIASVKSEYQWKNKPQKPQQSEVCVTIEDRLFFPVNALIFLEWVLIYFIILQKM